MDLNSRVYFVVKKLKYEHVFLFNFLLKNLFVFLLFEVLLNFLKAVVKGIKMMLVYSMRMKIGSLLQR